MGEVLVSFFEGVARKDKGRLDRLERDGRFSLEPDRLCFTLPDLHSFLQSEGAVSRSVGYKRFRLALFASPINRSVKCHGAEIVIVDGQGKVDKTRYALVWTSDA